MCCTSSLNSSGSSTYSHDSWVYDNWNPIELEATGWRSLMYKLKVNSFFSRTSLFAQINNTLQYRDIKHFRRNYYKSTIPPPPSQKNLTSKPKTSVCYMVIECWHQDWMENKQTRKDNDVSRKSSTTGCQPKFKHSALQHFIMGPLCLT